MRYLSGDGEKLIRDLILKNRSYRRFNESRKVSREELVDLVDLARTSASAANKQPLKFKLSWTDEMNDIIFPKIAWAGYLPDWIGPEEGERPAAYIMIFGDTRISTNYFVDHGIMAQSMLLGAVEKGLGGCIIAAFDKVTLKKELGIHGYLEPLLVIAIGEPVERVVIEPVEDGDIRYYRDEGGSHHVPKRSLKEIILS